jgi:hypothetical protein
MSSLWTDLLFLHGHFCDWRLARRMAGTASPADDPRAPAEQPAATPRPARPRLTWLRLCLGIGDGEVRRQ